MNIKAPRGTHDILPQDTPAWQFVEEKFRSVCDRFNFQEIRTPTFEQTELFQRGVGDTTDIVQKEMYTFLDKSGRSMTLRPEGTAGVGRAFLENGLSSEPSPQKFYYISNNFRYEKMGKGRYREFNQMGCELFGSEVATSDVELISLLFLFFRELGLKKINLKINSIGCPRCRPAYLDYLREYLRPEIDNLCDNCQDRFERNPMRILDCKDDAENAIIKNAPLQINHLCSQCQEHFDNVRNELDILGFDYEIDGHIVRGLDYYTRTVFEFVSNNVGTQGTICGGGRYDGLIEELGGQATPAVGFALGVERLFLELDSQKIELPQINKPDIYIVSFPDTAKQAAKLCFDLRTKQIRAENNLTARSFRSQMKYADRIQAKYLVVLGEDELKSEIVNLKCMSDGEEVSINLRELAEYIKNN